MGLKEIYVFDEPTGKAGNGFVMTIYEVTSLHNSRAEQTVHTDDWSVMNTRLEGGLLSDSKRKQPTDDEG